MPVNKSRMISTRRIWSSDSGTESIWRKQKKSRLTMFAIRIVYTILPPFKSPLLCLKEMCFKSFSTFPEHNLNALNYSHIPLNSAIQRPLLLTQFILKDVFCTRTGSPNTYRSISNWKQKYFLTITVRQTKPCVQFIFQRLGNQKETIQCTGWLPKRQINYAVHIIALSNFSDFWATLSPSHFLLTFL